jgi:hypothetical protein
MITYDGERFIAAGEDTIQLIKVIIREIGRGCNFRWEMGIHQEQMCYWTTKESDLFIEESDFFDLCDESVKTEIERREKARSEPINRIFYQDGHYIAEGGGMPARNGLMELGWQTMMIKGEYQLACSDPFVVDLSDITDLLDTSSSTALGEWRGQYQLKIAASSAYDTGAIFPSPQGKEFLPFQRAGIELCLQTGDKILGDEMGLGKTIQAIGVANAMEAQRVLVVCPSSLKINWQREIEEWKTEDILVTILAKPFAAEVPQGYVIVNYDILHQVYRQLDIFWDLMIFDEAHYLKNEDSRRTQIVFGENKAQAWKRIEKELCASVKKPYAAKDLAAIVSILDADPVKIELFMDHNPPLKIARLVSTYGKKKIEAEIETNTAKGLRGQKSLYLTGTPVPNRPVELWPILKKIDQEGFGAKREWFLDRYCDPTWNDFSHGWEYRGATNTEELGGYLRSKFLIRRLKADVLHELPDKTRQIIEIEPCGAVIKLIKEEIRNFERKEEISQELETIISRSDFHEQIKKLKVEMVAVEGNLATLRREIGIEKVPDVVKQIEMALENGAGKVVVMAHHHQVIGSLMETLKGYGVVKLDGTMNNQDKQASVDRFQTEVDGDIETGV